MKTQPQLPTRFREETGTRMCRKTLETYRLHLKVLTNQPQELKALIEQGLQRHYLETLVHWGVAVTSYIAKPSENFAGQTICSYSLTSS